MGTRKPDRKQGMKRACLWSLDQLGTFRKKLVQRAGRLTRPRGRLTLTMAKNERVADEYEVLLKTWGRRAA